MKLFKTASGKYKLTKQAWEEIGQKAGWKMAQSISGDEYIAKVGVNVWMPDLGNKYEIDAQPVFIPFSIDVEARSWGIKDISIYVSGTINVSLFVNVVNELGEEASSIDKEISVDLDAIKKEEVSGNGVYTLGDLDITLDKDFNVNYDKSYLEIKK